MSIFFIRTRFSSEQTISEAVRAAHLQYIGALKNKIRYGGLTASAKPDPTGICYFIDLGSREAAEQFIKNDPYYSLYSDVSIEEFVQRIP